MSPTTGNIIHGPYWSESPSKRWISSVNPIHTRQVNYGSKRYCLEDLTSICFIWYRLSNKYSVARFLLSKNYKPLVLNNRFILLFLVVYNFIFCPNCVSIWDAIRQTLAPPHMWSRTKPFISKAGSSQSAVWCKSCWRSLHAAQNWFSRRFLYLAFRRILVRQYRADWVWYATQQGIQGTT